MDYPGSSSDPSQVAEQLWHDFGGALGWDVGANAGQSLTQMLALCETVVSFEPATEAWETLTSDWGTEPRVMLENFALADSDDSLETAVCETSIQTGQLCASGLGYDMTHDASLPWGPQIEIRKVPCITADAYAAAHGVPDFAKVDTEGHEAHVLRGAEGILRAGRTDWLIEFHARHLHEECLRLFNITGYATETIRHPSYDSESELWHAHGWIRAVGPNTHVS